jgi:hypothetical protein
MEKLPSPAVWIEHFLDRLLQLAPTLNRVVERGGLT